MLFLPYSPWLIPLFCLPESAPVVDDWLRDNLPRLRALKAPSPRRKALLLLADDPARSPGDDAKLARLVRAERASDKARRDTNAVLTSDAKAARKARDHNRFQAAGLLTLAGLLDPKTGTLTSMFDASELLGGLLELAGVPMLDQRRMDWRRAGTKRLSDAKASAAQSKPASPTTAEARTAPNGGSPLPTPRKSGEGAPRGLKPVPDADGRTFIAVPRGQHEAAGELGAIWDESRRARYVPAGLDLEPFRQWWPQ